MIINDVRENSPAAKGGLKAGDIIVEIDGKVVRGDGDLSELLNERKEGEVTLTVVRDGAGKPKGNAGKHERRI